MSVDLIFLHGAPGTGKSTVARALHETIGCPYFEFGWIPEFRTQRQSLLTWEEEEAFSFDNLSLVAKNYVRRGFDNVVVTDINDTLMQKVPRRFARYRWLLATLFVTDDALLKARVLDETRTSGYRNWEEALAINRKILARPPRRNEIRFDATHRTPDKIVADLLPRLGRSTR